MAGGVTIANFPQEAKNRRRSSLASDDEVESKLFNAILSPPAMMFLRQNIMYAFNPQKIYIVNVALVTFNSLYEWNSLFNLCRIEPFKIN
jgi:hypothetical protein